MKMAFYGASSGHDVYYDTDSIKEIRPRYIYIVNVNETFNFRYDDMAFSSMREVARFIESIAPSALTWYSKNRSCDVAGGTSNNHHIFVTRALRFRDGGKTVIEDIQFHITIIEIDKEYAGMKYRRSY